jgi:hypothetical protein
MLGFLREYLDGVVRGVEARTAAQRTSSSVKIAQRHLYHSYRGLALTGMVPTSRDRVSLLLTV